MLGDRAEGVEPAVRVVPPHGGTSAGAPPGATAFPPERGPLRPSDLLAPAGLDLPLDGVPVKRAARYSLRMPRLPYPAAARPER